jgi:hypothetical protein
VLWVQSPTGMPATHSSCIGSGGRNRTCVGCVLQRCWDASNPHLNSWRASKELHPTSGLWRPVPRYEDRPKLAERGGVTCRKRHGLLQADQARHMRASRLAESGPLEGHAA